jgi:hypothetical protein
MTQFTTPADLRVLDGKRWELLTAFVYHVGQYPSAHVITVPAGFVTDLASVPRFLWVVFPPHGRYAKAAIVHDWLYSHGNVSRKQADLIFLEGMLVLGVPHWKARVLYFAVRLFGGAHFKSLADKI